MKLNFGRFLPLLLALIAMLILMGNGCRKDEAIATTAPASQETTGSTSAPEQTTPPQTAAPAANGAKRVEQILEEHPLDETALSYCVYEKNLNKSGDTDGLGKKAGAFTLAKLCDEQRMNPIAAFWILTTEGLYDKEPDASGVLGTPAFEPPDWDKKSYPCTADGARELLTDLLTTAAMVDDGLELEEKLLGRNDAVEADQVFHAPGDCFYAYFVCYGERSAHFLCFYLRGGETITDVEFQLLNLRYAMGEAEALSRIDQLGDRQAAALMTASELLLTGYSRAAEGRIPFSHELMGCKAAIERFDFTGGEEAGSLTNYRIRK